MILKELDGAFTSCAPAAMKHSDIRRCYCRAVPLGRCPRRRVRLTSPVISARPALRDIRLGEHYPWPEPLGPSLRQHAF